MAETFSNTFKSRLSLIFNVKIKCHASHEVLALPLDYSVYLEYQICQRNCILKLITQHAFFKAEMKKDNKK